MEIKPGYRQSEVGIIPEDWEIKELCEVVDFLDGHRRPVKDSDREKMRGDIPYYGASGIVDYVNSYLFDEDLILLGEDGENILSRAVPLVFEIHGKTWVNNHAHVLRPKSSMVPKFLVEYLESRDYSQYNTGTAQPKLNKLVCSHIPVLCPSIGEQRAIGTTLSDADALLEGLERLIAKKRDLKQAAMQQLLTGRTRLPGYTGDWVKKPLGSEVIDLEAGVSVNSVEDEFDSGSGRPGVLKTSAVANGRFIPSESKTIASRDLKRVKLNPRAESVIISRMNTPDLVGECGYVPTDFPNLFIPDRLWMTRFNEGSRVSARWLAFTLSMPASRQLLRNIATGTSGSMKNISKGAFLALEFAFPDPAEQDAIATVISDIDAELAALEKRFAKTRDLKDAMMQELLTGKTRLIAPQAVHA